MQSPCLNEYLESCLLQGCCPAPLLGYPEPLNSKPTTKTTTTTTMSTARRNFATSATASSSNFSTPHFTNPDSLPSLHHSFMEFTKTYPQYSTTYSVDEIRTQHFQNLSRDSNHTCLDYIGIGLFSCSQIQQSVDQSTGQFVSDHSDVPFFTVCYKAGNLKTRLLHGGQESDLESAMKKRVMRFMNISEKDYSMVFTANRTSAFKLLAESYPFGSSSSKKKTVLSVYDYESEAVEAMNRITERKGGKVKSAEFSWPRLRINSAKLKKMILSKNKNKKKKRGIFVFPLHSRMTGARYPYSWMRTAQENDWHLLIDACALGPKDMDSFALALIRPDFVVSSFYKIFGENPSGFGCLFVKKSTIPLMEDYTGAGMVSLLPGKIDDDDAKVENFMSRLEFGDGDQDDLDNSNSFSGPINAPKSGRLSKMREGRRTTSIVECRGLDQVDSLGLTEITNRGRCLINWLVNALTKLKHPTKSQEIPLVRIYGPKVKFDRGPAMAFNVFDWKGAKIEPSMVQKLADRNNISLSYGFLHHISFSDKYEAEKAAVLETKGGSSSDKKKDKGIAVVTIALGFLSNFEDAYRLWAFIAQFLDADFVEKANWRYTGLNQKTIEV